MAENSPSRATRVSVQSKSKLSCRQIHEDYNLGEQIREHSKCNKQLLLASLAKHSKCNKLAACIFFFRWFGRFGLLQANEDEFSTVDQRRLVTISNIHAWHEYEVEEH